MATKRSPSVREAARRRDGACLYGMVVQDGCVPGFDVAHIRGYGVGRSANDVLENVICLCRKHHEMHHRAEIEDLALQLMLYNLYGYGPDQWITDKLDIINEEGIEAGYSMFFKGDHRGVAVRFIGTRSTVDSIFKLSAIESMMPETFREMVRYTIRRRQ